MYKTIVLIGTYGQLDCKQSFVQLKKIIIMPVSNHVEGIFRCKDCNFTKLSFYSSISFKWVLHVWKMQFPGGSDDKKSA